MAKRPCARAGCPNVVDRGYCATCKPGSQAAASERLRLSAHRRGYDRTWQRYSAARLKRLPWCTDPYGRHDGQVELATMTDHITPHKGDMTLFWNEQNHQSLCDGCNSYKAAKYEGGFGNQSAKACRG